MALQIPYVIDKNTVLDRNDAIRKPIKCLKRQNPFIKDQAHEENKAKTSANGNYYCLLPTKANSKWFYYSSDPLHATDVQPGEKAADNIVFAHTYKPYMYKVNEKLNIAFALKTAFADQLGRRHYPSLYDHLDVALEKVAPVFDVKCKIPTVWNLTK